MTKPHIDIVATVSQPVFNPIAIETRPDGSFVIKQNDKMLLARDRTVLANVADAIVGVLAATWKGAE